MEKTPKQIMMEELIVFSKLCQLPLPEPDYLKAIMMGLSAYKWNLGDFKRALRYLTQDDSYAEIARFGKYPTLHDFLRVKKQADSQPFYRALSAYLAGDWWEKDTIKELATPEQANAIYLSGGLENLYARATGDKPTPVYKLVEIVSKNESDTPVEIIDTSHRIGMSSMKQIMDATVKDKPKEL